MSSTLEHAEWNNSTPLNEAVLEEGTEAHPSASRAAAAAAVRRSVRSARALRALRMASWAEFEAAEPEFAARARALLSSRKHLTLATLRRDGSPRISGTEIEFAEGQLRIGSMPGAVKATDLRRDPRLAIHGPTADPPPGRPAGWKGEAKLAGRAHEVDSGGQAHRFHIDIGEVVITRLNKAGDRLVIESWSPARGYRERERD